jgi:hypothetical protein
VWPWITDVAKAKTWNDEPALRHWNIALTQWMEGVVCKPLIQSALTLSIFVQQVVCWRILFRCFSLGSSHLLTPHQGHAGLSLPR